MTLDKQETLAAVEIGSLAVGSSMVAFPGVMSSLGGANAAVGAHAPMVRSLGFWLTAYGALLQYAEREDERERLLLAGAAVGSAYCLNAFVAAGRRKLSWRGALTQVAMVGTMVGFACAYLAD